MTKAELLLKLASVPDDAEIVTADDMPITGLTILADLEGTIVYLEDDGEIEG